MKKSLIALLLSSLFLLSACDDKNLSQKVLETEKRLVQTEAELKQAQNELASKEQALAKLQADFARTQDDLSKASNSIPALQVEIVGLFHKNEKITHPKDPKDEFYRESSQIQVFANTAKTGLAWLDQLLLKQLFLEGIPENEKAAFADKTIHPADLQAQLQKLYDAFVADSKEFKPHSMDQIIQSNYLGQRNHIATFSQSFYSYTGGAHGMSYNRYINVDLKKQSLIRLDDLVSPQNQKALSELLWTQYADERRDEQGNVSTFTEKQDFYIAQDFYFNEDGIVFAYPVYTLGPYAEGDIYLRLHFSQINALLNPAYQRTAKDGFDTVTFDF